MSRAATSILSFGVYLATTGVALVAVPEIACGLLGIAAPPGAWPRIVGMLLLILGFFCWRAAVEENTRFMRWSLLTRPTAMVFLAWFVASGWIEPSILLFGAVDVVAAAWTFAALGADARAALRRS